MQRVPGDVPRFFCSLDTWQGLHSCLLSLKLIRERSILDKCLLWEGGGDLVQIAVWLSSELPDAIFAHQIIRRLAFSDPLSGTTL